MKLLVITVLALGITLPAFANQQNILEGYKAQIKNFQSFSDQRGHNLFSSSPATGKPETPSCTTCHTSRPTDAGRTRAGKDISPMALSKTPERYTDPKKVEKWFRRNCNSVLGRECTPQEKGDFVTFMLTQ